MVLLAETLQTPKMVWRSCFSWWKKKTCWESHNPTSGVQFRCALLGIWSDYKCKMEPYMQHLPYQFGRYWKFLSFQPFWEIWHSKTLLRNSPSTHLYPHVSHLLTKSLLLPCLVFGRWFMWFASNLRVEVENVWSLITECLWRAHSTCRSGGARLG